MKKIRVFRKVAYHMLTQNKKSETGHNCWYRFDTDPKIRCAIGCLIDDRNYSKDLEGRSIENPKVQEAISLSLDEPIASKDVRFLKELQDIHDYDHVDDWHDKLNKFAKDKFNQTLYEMELI